MDEFLMMRSAQPDDTTGLLSVAAATGLFEPEQLGTLSEMLADHFQNKDPSEQMWITVDRGGPIGVAYIAREAMTQGTWNLYLIAIHPDYQGQGYGTRLIRYVESQLVAVSARLLLVETSADFEQARSFYRQYGFEEEAQIRDFYAAGADKIVYRKLLTS